VPALVCARPCLCPHKQVLHPPLFVSSQTSIAHISTKTKKLSFYLIEKQKVSILAMKNGATWI
jgi:hypothetical protein